MSPYSRTYARHAVKKKERGKKEGFRILNELFLYIGEYTETTIPCQAEFRL